MKNLLVIALFGAIVWFGYGKHKARETFTEPPASPVAALKAPPATPQFSCDGRTHCSQMRSCEEAMYFLQNCPNTKMDGNNDGIPCERQWCR